MTTNYQKLGEQGEKLIAKKCVCPKCKNNQAVWWLLQTRSGDEPPTQFYRCTKCAQTWREYS